MKAGSSGWRVATLLAVANVVLCMVVCYILFPIMMANSDRKLAWDEYDEIGWNLAQGKGFRAAHGEESVARGPGYPVFLAAIYLLAGGMNHALAQFAQCLVSGANVLLVYHLAKRTVGGRTALLATGIYAFHPLSFYYSASIYLEVVLSWLFLVTVILIERFARRPTPAMLIAVGLPLTAAIYVKSFSVVLIAVLFIWLLVMKHGLLGSIAWTAGAVLIAVVLISPWTLRNARLTDRFIPVHATIGLPLIAGHTIAEEWLSSPLSFNPPNIRSFKRLTEIAEQYGLPETHWPYRSLQEELACDKAAMAFMSDYYTHDPLALVRNTAVRFVQFWYLSGTNIFSIVMIPISLVVIPLAVYGILVNRDKRNRWLPFAVLAVYVGLQVPIIGIVRLSVPIQPYLLILAAAGATAVWDRFRQTATAA